MADTIQAQYDVLEEISNRFSGLAQSNEQMQRMLQQKVDVLQQQWSGEGSTAFIAEMHDVVFPATQRLLNSLEESSQVTLQIAQLLGQAEENAAAAFSVGSGMELPIKNGGTNVPGENFVPNLTPGFINNGVVGQNFSSSASVKGFDTIIDKGKGFVDAISNFPSGGGINEVVGIFNKGKEVYDALKKGVSAEGTFSLQDSMYSNSIQGKFGHASVDALGYDVHGSGSAKLSLDGLQAKGSVAAEAYLGRAKFDAEYGPVSASGEAFVGARANASGELNIDPRKGIYNVAVQGDAFIGAEASAKGKVDLGPVGSIEASASAMAGIGAKGHFDAGYKDGKVTVDFGAGLSLGIGAGFDVKFDLNVKPIVDTVNKVVDVVKDVGEGISEIWDSIF